MKTINLFFTFSIILAMNINLNISALTGADSLEIKDTCLDYLEGWYSGKVERMEKALHPNLVMNLIFIGLMQKSFKN